MIATGHVEVLRVKQLPAEQSDDAFDGEGTSVYEISVEEVGISLTGVAVDLKDIHQVVVLPVNVSADIELVLIGNFDVDEGRLKIVIIFNFGDYLHEVLLVKEFVAFHLLHDS